MGVFSLSTLVVVAIVAFDYRLMRMRCNFNRLTFGGIEQAWGVLAREAEDVTCLPPWLSPRPTL